jgi:hypothetical protein
MLDRDSAAFIQTGVSISLAACGEDRVPTMSRGMGCKILDGGQRVGVFIRRSQSEQLLKNIRNSGRVACVFSLPSSNRTVQLKGIDARILPFDASDLQLIKAHVTDFLEEVLPLGMQEAVVRALFAVESDDLAMVSFSAMAVFSQTPGPNAGQRLDANP